MRHCDNLWGYFQQYPWEVSSARADREGQGEVSWYTQRVKTVCKMRKNISYLTCMPQVGSQYNRLNYLNQITVRALHVFSYFTQYICFDDVKHSLWKVSSFLYAHQLPHSLMQMLSLLGILKVLSCEVEGLSPLF